MYIYLSLPRTLSISFYDWIYGTCQVYTGERGREQPRLRPVSPPQLRDGTAGRAEQRQPIPRPPALQPRHAVKQAGAPMQKSKFLSAFVKSGSALVESGIRIHILGNIDCK